MKQKTVPLIAYLGGFCALFGMLTAAPILHAQSSSEPAPGSSSNHNVVPNALILASGTQLQLRTEDNLSAGDGHFIAVLVQPVVVDGWVVAKAGEYIVGDVAPVAQTASAASAAGFELQISKFLLVDGRVVPLKTSPVRVDTNTPIHTHLTFALQQPLSISTASSRSAFRAVTHQDYINYPFGTGPVKIPPGYDPPCCLDANGVGAFAGDGYGYPYYYSAGYFPPPVVVEPYYGWHGKRWGW